MSEPPEFYEHYPWVRSDRAALYLGVTQNNVRVLAYRRRWPSAPLDGRWHGYHIRDLERERDRRETLRRLRDELHARDSVV